MKTAIFAVLMAIGSLTWAAQEGDEEGCRNVDSGSYSDIAMCGHSKFLRADKELNQSYRQLLKALEKDAPRRKLVLDSQRAWLVYRDKSCDFWSELMRYNIPWCKFAITEQRVKELKHMHDCFVEAGGAC